MTGQFAEQMLFGERLPPISLGASALGGGVFGPVEERTAIRTVHRALDLGVRLIDVSPFYGATRAEQVLGRALRGIPRERYLLSTKVGRYGEQDFDFSADRVRRSLDASLMRLGVDHVDLLLAHDVEYGNLQQIEEETLPALENLRVEGKARLIGASGYPLSPLLRLAKSGLLQVVLSYNHLCLNDSTLLHVLPELQAARVSVISAAPLGQGLLTDHGTPPWHPAPENVKRLCAEVATFVRERGSSLAKLAIQFSVQQAGVVTTLVGTPDPDELEHSVQWAAEPVDESLLAEVQDRLAPIANVTWALVGSRISPE